MQLLNDILLPATGLLGGLTIGYAFGKLQEMALARNQQRLQSGLLHNGWSLVPGSMTRVVILLLALVLVQFTCPLLFTHYNQWCVSGGVVAGYGTVLLGQLRQRLAARR